MVKKIKRIHPVKKRGGKTSAHVRRPKNKEEEMDEGLRAIYGDRGDDLAVVTPGGSRLTYWLMRVIGFLAFAALIVFAVIMLSSRGSLLNTGFSPLILRVEVPSEVVSGQEVTIKIPYENPENVPLASLEIDVNLPPTFVVTDILPAPTNTEELLFSLGSIAPRGKGELTLQGTWLTNVPTTTAVQAIGSYRPANFSSEFSQIASTSVTTKTSVLAVSMTGPDEAAPGAAISYDVTVKNTGEKEAKNVRVELVPPPGFTATKSTPVFSAGDRPVWNFEMLGAGEEKKLTVTGTFASDVTDDQKMQANVDFVTGEGLDEKALVQASANVLTAVLGGALRLTLVGNGLSGDTAVAPGDALRLGYRLENTGISPLSDATVTIDFQPETGIPLVWSKANLDKGVMKKEGVYFDAKTIGVINPDEKKSFNLSFPVKTELAEGDTDTFTVVARATVNGSTIQSSPLTVRVNAAVGFAATAHYYSTDGAPIGEGPLPPVVGSGTTFEVMWTITHALHPLEDLVITASLPPNVTFAGGEAADAGKVSYDAGANVIRFDATDVAKDFGAVHAKFYLKATPQSTDVGKAMKLLSGSVLRVTDAETENRIEKETESLTTSLPDDSFASGKGIVVAQ